ncbi:helix-turn-helix domain-containing protein [Roseiconus nitratireducens]|uniref:Helix-turn-helix domain-containing protein n=1 Tax=Roseiconus nitratireducens TaxID=2605748 RepID=A0A5M6DNK4_9BACT|nr:helix-turn-helix domain-containing protein [Roseiconus nitratireducens]
MLEVHRTDRRILQAIDRTGSTVGEIHSELKRKNIDSISRHTIRRHLPGLERLGLIARHAVTRNDRVVTAWCAKQWNTSAG